MTQRHVIPAENGSKNVTNNDRSVAYVRGECFSADIANRSRQSKYSINLLTRMFVIQRDLKSDFQKRQDAR